MEYSDFPMPRTYPDYPHHTQIAAYFDAYVDHFGFRDRIRFDTTVRHARRGEDGRGWVLEAASGEPEEYDALVVANGHHWDERWPEPAFPGHETTQIQQIHAHGYRSDEVLRGKDVVVVGMGNSAMDIAVESSYVARSHAPVGAARGLGRRRSTCSAGPPTSSRTTRACRSGSAAG